MTQTEQEFFERCMLLEEIRFELEDKIEDILDYLMKSNLTLEEMYKVQEIAYGETYTPTYNKELKRALEIF